MKSWFRPKLQKTMGIASTLSFLVVCFCLLVEVLVISSAKTLESFSILEAEGPESLVFDLIGKGPYTGVADGRILRHGGPELGFLHFAHSSPTWSKEECDDGTKAPELGPKCGRALGLGFNYRTQELYIADAYFGLCKVGPEGGLAKQLVTAAEGVSLKWPDALDVDSVTGMVYFTDISTKYTIREISEVLRTRDQTGRFISYNPVTDEVKVLLKGLHGPGGVTVSADGSFVLISEFFTDKILKYWLKGPNATKTEEIVVGVPSPTNIKRTASGHFWIATNLNLLNPDEVATPGGLKIDEFGRVMESFSLAGIYNGTAITEVQEFGDSVYVASLYLPFASVSQKIDPISAPWMGATLYE